MTPNQNATRRDCCYTNEHFGTNPAFAVQICRFIWPAEKQLIDNSRQGAFFGVIFFFFSLPSEYISDALPPLPYVPVSLLEFTSEKNQTRLIGIYNDPK